MTQMTQQDINGVVWRACDTFRGTIDPAQYKDYILVMLFLKYLTDLRNDKREEYRKKYKGDETRVERAMGRERFVLRVREPSRTAGRANVRVSSVLPAKPASRSGSAWSRIRDRTQPRSRAAPTILRSRRQS